MNSQVGWELTFWPGILAPTQDRARPTRPSTALNQSPGPRTSPSQVDKSRRRACTPEAAPPGPGHPSRRLPTIGSAAGQAEPPRPPSSPCCPADKAPSPAPPRLGSDAPSCRAARAAPRRARCSQLDACGTQAVAVLTWACSCSAPPPPGRPWILRPGGHMIRSGPRSATVSAAVFFRTVPVAEWPDARGDARQHRGP